MIGDAIGVPVPLACAAFTLLIGGTCFVTSASQMDRINSVLVALVSFSGFMHASQLLSPVDSDLLHICHRI